MIQTLMEKMTRYMVEWLVSLSLEGRLTECGQQINDCIIKINFFFLVFHNRSKHINTRYHFIRGCTMKNEVQLKFTKSQDQIMNIFTKPLKLKILEG